MNTAGSHRRPTTPETRAPTPLLGHGAGLRHSASSQASRLRKIHAELEHESVIPSSNAYSVGKNMGDAAHPPSPALSSMKSPILNEDLRSSWQNKLQTSNQAHPHQEHKSNHRDNVSSVFVGLEKEKRSLVRKRPWERELPHLASLQNEVNVLLKQQNIFHEPNPENSLFSDPQDLGSSSQTERSQLESVSHGILWSKTRAKRYPAELMYHRYSFTPRLHLDLTNWADEIDDEIFFSIASRVASDGARVSHLTLDRARYLSSSGFKQVFRQKNPRDTAATTSVVGFPRLEALSARYCAWISKSALRLIVLGCPRLVRLTLDGCLDITNDCMTVIAEHTSVTLQCLDIKNCVNVSDAGMVKVVTSCQNLKELGLEGCKLLTDRTLLALTEDTEAPGMIGTVNRPADLPPHAPLKLERLSVANCVNVTDESMCLVVERVKTLTHLDLSGCSRLTDKTAWSCMETETIYGPRPNGGLPRLRYIDISRVSQFTEMAISQITAAAFPLQTVNLRGCCGIKDQGAKALASLVHVTNLDLSGCSQITSRGLNYMGNGSITRKLRFLRLVGMGEYAFDDGFRSLILRCRAITYLDVSDNEDRISDGCLGGILSTCRRLTHVRFCGLPLPGLFTLECVARSLGTGKSGDIQILQNIDLSRCAGLSDEGIIEYLRDKKSAFAINLSGCKGLTRDGILSTPNWRLHTLGIADMASGEVDDALVDELSYSHPDLTALDLSGNPHVTAASIDLLRERCPKLICLNVCGCGIYASDGSNAGGDYKLRLKHACTRFAANRDASDISGFDDIDQYTRQELGPLSESMGALPSLSFPGGTTRPMSAFEFFSDPNVSDSYTLRHKKFVGLRPSFQSQSASIRKRFWLDQKKEIEAAITAQCAYRSYISRLRFTKLKWRRDNLKWLNSISIQAQWRAHTARAYAAAFRLERESACFLLQYVWRRTLLRRAKRKAVLMWKNRALSKVFNKWHTIALQQIQSRMGANEIAWRNRADEFHRNHIIQKWFRPIIVKWRFWAHEQVTEREHKRNAHARALSYFRNHNLVKCMKMWRAKIVERKHIRRHLNFVFMQACHLTHHNRDIQRANYAKADAVLRHKSRVIVLEILHKNVEMVHAAVAAARRHAIMTFRNRMTMASWRSWIQLRDWRRKHKADIKKGERHWYHTRTRVALKEFSELVARAKKRRADAQRALNYWINAQISQAFKGWHASVLDKIYARELARRALAYMRNRLMAMAFHEWKDNVRDQIQERLRQQALKRRNETVVRRALVRLRYKTVQKCFIRWDKETQRMQQFRVRFLMKWRRREIAYFFYHWVELMEEYWELQYQGSLKKIRDDAAATQIQRIARGMLAKAYWEREKHACEWAARMMQGAYRIRLAKKYLYKLWRRQYLKDYIQATEIELPMMEREDVMSAEHESWWRASSFIAWQWEAYKARRFMWPVRAEAQKKKKEFEKKKMIEVMEEAERREERRQILAERKEEVAIVIERLWRGWVARQAYHRRWLRQFYERVMNVLQRNVRARQGRLRWLARSRWLVMKRKIYWERKKLAFVLRRLGYRKRQSQEQFMNSLAAFGFHPETYNLNPFIVIKQILLDAIAAKTAVTDQIKLLGAGGFKRDRRAKLWKIIARRRTARYTPVKGHAVKIIGKNTKRRGETGYVVRIDVRGRKQEKILKIKLDKDGKILLQRYFSGGSASEEALPNMQIVCTKCARILSSNGHTCRRCQKKHFVDIDHGFFKMDAQKVLDNEMRLRLEGERMGILYKEAWAARKLQQAFRARRSRRKVQALREKILRHRKRWIWRYRKIFGCLHMKSYQWREWFIEKKLIKEEFLPIEYYPVYDCVPMWYKKRVIRGREAKARALEERMALTIRRMKVDKSSRRSRKELMDFRVWTKNQYRKDWFYGAIRAATRHKLATKLARCTDGGTRRSCGARMALGIAGMIGNKSWRKTHEDRKTWARFYQFESLIDSPHVTASGWAMYHGMMNAKGEPHGRGHVVFPRGQGYSQPSTRANEKQWLIYSTISGFFENGNPVGDVIIVYKGGMLYQGLYNGEPPPKAIFCSKTLVEEESFHAIMKARNKYLPKEESEKQSSQNIDDNGTNVDILDDETGSRPRTAEGGIMARAMAATGGTRNSEDDGENLDGEHTDSENSESGESETTEQALIREEMERQEKENEISNENIETLFGGRTTKTAGGERPWTPGPEIIPKIFRPSTVEKKSFDLRFKNRPQSVFKKMYPQDRFVSDEERLAPPGDDGTYNFFFGNKMEYDPASKRLYQSAYSADPLSAELMRLPDRHMGEMQFTSYARLGLDDDLDDRVPVAVQDTAIELWNLLPLNMEGRANVEDILMSLQSPHGSIYKHMKAGLHELEVMRKTFEDELAASNKRIFEDDNGENSSEAAINSMEKSAGEGVQEASEARINDDGSRPVTSSSLNSLGPVKVNGFQALNQLHKEALAHRNSWLTPLSKIPKAPEYIPRSRTPSILGSPRPGSALALSQRPFSPGSVTRPVSRQSVISFGAPVEIQIMETLAETPRDHNIKEKRSYSLLEKMGGDKVQHDSDEDADHINKDDAGYKVELLGSEENSERETEQKMEDNDIVRKSEQELEDDEVSTSTPIPTPLPTPRRPDENRTMDQLQFERIIIEILGQADIISDMYKILRETAESRRVTPKHVTSQWDKNPKLRLKAQEIENVNLMSSGAEWPPLLEAVAPEWNEVNTPEEAMDHNLPLDVFMRCVWDIHSGNHSARQLFAAARLKNVITEINSGSYIQGAGVEGWEKFKQSLMLEPSTSKEAGTEVANIGNSDDSLPLIPSVSVSDFYDSLDAEIEIDRALDRELEGLNSKQVKKILKKRKKAAKKEAKRRRKMKEPEPPPTMRQLAESHALTAPSSRIEWYEKFVVEHFPKHLPLTPFALCFRVACVLCDQERDDEEKAQLRARTPAADGEINTDDNWGKVVLTNGEIYEGYTVDNNFDPQGPSGKGGLHGRHFVTLPSMEMYDGDLIAGTNHGYGRYYYDDMTEYEGFWFDGKKHGKGLLMIHTGETYKGDWRNDQMHGYGVHTFVNGTEYEGTYENGIWHGKGILTKPNGLRYEGSFLNGKFHGFGRINYPDGGYYIGDFREGVRHGHGVYDPPPSEWNRSEFAEQYIGAWARDVMHGAGTYTVEMPEGWTKVREGIWVLGTLKDWTKVHHNDIATDRFCESFAGRGALAAYAAAQFSHLEYQKVGFHTDDAKTRGAYSQFVAENLPHLPPGVNPADRRVRVIVRAIVNQWLHSYGLVEREIVCMDTLVEVQKALKKIRPEVEEALDQWKECKVVVEEEREALAEQHEVFEEEEEAYKEGKAEEDKLRVELDRFWIDRDEANIKPQWEKMKERIMHELVTKDFYNIRTTSKPNPVLKKLMHGAAMMCYNTLKDMNEKYGQTNEKTGEFIPWQVNDEKTDGEWWASKNLIMKSEDNAQRLDMSALLNGPYDVKLWDELKR